MVSLARKTATSLAILMAIAALWYMLGMLGLLSNVRFPTIMAVVDAAVIMQPPLTEHIQATSTLVFLGFVLGVLAAWLVAGVVLLSDFSRPMILALTNVLRGVPPVCLIPFFILWFGFEPSGKLILIALNVALVVYPTLVSHFQSIDINYKEAWSCFGRSSARFVIREGISATAASMLPTYRFALSFAVMLAIIAESMGSTLGLGHLISVALSTFALGSVVAASLAAAIVAAFFDLILMMTFRIAFPWTASQNESEDVAF
jgi:NitT/TauT family transport system permease protein/taurine transport system permease protein